MHQRRYPARLVHESLNVPLRSYIGGRELWRGPSASALHYHPHGVQSVVLPKLYLRGLLGGPAASAGGRVLPSFALDWYDDKYTRNRTTRCYPGMAPSRGLALQCRAWCADDPVSVVNRRCPPQRPESSSSPELRIGGRTPRQDSRFSWPPLRQSTRLRKRRHM